MKQPRVKKAKKVILIILDGLGVGALPDSLDYEDAATVNTLASIDAHTQKLYLPYLQKMGIGNITPLKQVTRSKIPTASYGKAMELSKGKDTTTGHWEIAGVYTKEAFATFLDGFSESFIEEFLKKTELPGVLGNKKASGTKIIEELGEEHIKTKKPILYTSADSVLQIACHEKYFGIKNLYRICEIARKQSDAMNISRVIARPFVGEKKGEFQRTGNRKDYSIKVPKKTVLDYLMEAGQETISIGKVASIYNHTGFSKEKAASNNREIMEVLLKEIQETPKGLLFANFVDFDMLYGHRRDPEGYEKELEWFDRKLPQITSLLDEEDLLIITADHGNDPAAHGTDHTREYIPILAYSINSEKKGGVNLQTRESFADIGQTILDAFHINKKMEIGTSFWSMLP